MRESTLQALRFAQEVTEDYRFEKRLFWKEVFVILFLVVLFVLRQLFLWDDEAHGEENPTLEDYEEIFVQEPRRPKLYLEDGSSGA